MKVTAEQIQRAAASPAMAKAIAVLINEALEGKDAQVQSSAQVIACFLPKPVAKVAA